MGTAIARADVVFTIEGPGVQQTSVPGAITETFDSPSILNAPLSAYHAANGGTYTGGMVVPGGGAYGGAYESPYLVIGLAAGIPTATATFATDLTYFGMWWAAGDTSNELRFYDDAVLLKSFVVGDLLAFLSADYYGNPNNGKAASEPFVYINFTATEGTRFNRISFTSSSASGFESDNHSTYDKPITPPGIPTTPDAGSTAAMLVMGLGLLGAIRRVR